MLQKWLSTVLSSKKEPESAAPEPAAPVPPKLDSASEQSSSELILRDVYLSPFRTTFIEVRTDGIHLMQSNKSGQTEFIPIEDPPSDTRKYNDIDEGIRCQIARKIAGLMPELGEGSTSELSQYAIDVLRFLAKDQIERVRRIISEELKDLPNAPKDVVQALIWDSDLKVRLPLLEFSPLIGEYELLDIIAGAPVPGVLEAIANRSRLSAKVSAAIVESGQPQAITNLLENETASINQESIEKIIDRAPQYVLWHEPLLKRPELTHKTINKIASFVSVSLIRVLQEDQKIKPELAEMLMHAVSSRLKSSQVDKERAAEIRANELYMRGELNQEAILQSLDYGEPEFAIIALSILSRLGKPVVEKMITSQSPKVMVSLAWKAGLSMRAAIQMQLRLARIHHARVINAREGVNYPMSETEMLHYIDLFAEYNE